jgi:hypothetical protein
MCTAHANFVRQSKQSTSSEQSTRLGTPGHTSNAMLRLRSSLAMLMNAKQLQFKTYRTKTPDQRSSLKRFDADMKHL